MTYTYKIGIDASEHDNFVISSDQTNLLQSSKWANIKNNWKNDRIGFYENNNLVAVASVLIQPLPLGFTIIYIPRGPIMDYKNKNLLKFVLSTLKKYGKTKRALFIKFDPTLFIKKQLVSSEIIEQDNKETFDIINNLISLGADWTGRTTDIAENIQPRFQANIYKENFNQESIPKKNIKRIAAVRNKGVTIEFGTIELIPEFAELMKKTENRKGINLRNADYYKNLLDTYGDNAYITMARLNLVERKAKLEQQLEKVKIVLSKSIENNRPTKIMQSEEEISRLEKEIKFLNSKITTGNNNVALAATLSINFGETSENIYAGMDEDYKTYNPALLTWYETANHAFELGAKWQNMGGIENNLNGGLYHFKSNYNPTIEEFAGEFNLPTNKFLYLTSNLIYKLRKKLRTRNKNN